MPPNSDVSVATGRTTDNDGPSTIHAAMLSNPSGVAIRKDVDAALDGNAFLAPHGNAVGKTPQEHRQLEPHGCSFENGFHRVPTDVGRRWSAYESMHDTGYKEAQKDVGRHLVEHEKQ